MSGDLIEIETKIAKLEKELDDLKNIRTLIIAKNFKMKYKKKRDQQRRLYFLCEICKEAFNCGKSLEKHIWSTHPSNRYEIAMANTNWDTYQ
tara:strand:+ start:431 stop:706 length:276 start_codon:yes stop_codon:yes gene_type:complete